MVDERYFGLFLVALLFAVAQTTPIRPAKQHRVARDTIDGRLPRNVVPRHYNVEVTPDIYSSPEPPFYFTGSVEIYITCQRETNYILVNDKGLDYKSVSVVADPNSPVGTPSPILLQWSYDPIAEFLSLEVVNPLVPGAYYIIRVTYEGVLRNDGLGLYWDSYVDTDGSTKYLVASQMVSHEARSVFPSFDEPDLKATFNITVVSQPPSVTLSNMPIVATQDRTNGWVAYSFGTTPVMSTYLVCIIVGNFVAVEAQWQNVTSYPITIYARPQMADKLEYAARVAPLMQAWLEQETGIPYLLPKLDHIALPSKSGAMENWGLITYSEYYLCVDRQTSSAAGTFEVASVISHEQAHQWYGNLVTAKWWNDIWLNEGFATYYNYYPQASLGRDGGELHQSDPRRGLQLFLQADQLNTSDPIRKKIDTVWQANSAFPGSTYPKGGAMLRMLQSLLSQSTFKRGLTSFLTKYSYGSAETDDLWAVLSEQARVDGIKNPDGSDVDVKAWMDAWLNQMGYPVLVVTRNGDGTATVTSRRFLSPRGQSPDVPSDYNYSWNVPITVASPSTSDWDARPSFVLPYGQTTTTITGLSTTPGDWFLLNAKEKSFYRVDYDSLLRDDIVNQLANDHSVIPVESRAQFIDDSFVLARSLNMPATFAMDTTLYLNNELHYNAWGAAFRHLLYVDRLVSASFWHSSYRTYIVNQVQPIYDQLGWSYTDSESPLQQFLRRDAILYMCFFGDENCRSVARAQYASYIANPDVNSINANNLPTVLCVGISEGSATDWSIAFEQYQKRSQSPIREERYAYLFALACSSDSTWHDRLLNYIIRGDLISTRDANTALYYMTQSRIGLPVVWRYLTNSWSSVPSFINKNSALQSIVSTFASESRSNEFNNFIGTYPPTTQSDLEAIRQMDLIINQNVDFINSNEQGLIDWLDVHLPLHRRPLGAPLPMSAVSQFDWLAPGGKYF